MSLIPLEGPPRGPPRYYRSRYEVNLAKGVGFDSELRSGEGSRRTEERGSGGSFPIFENQGVDPSGCC